MAKIILLFFSYAFKSVYIIFTLYFSIIFTLYFSMVCLVCTTGLSRTCNPKEYLTAQCYNDRMTLAHLSLWTPALNWHCWELLGLLGRRLVYKVFFEGSSITLLYFLQLYLTCLATLVPPKCTVFCTCFPKFCWFEGVF